MDNYSTIYWITRLDNITSFLIFTLVISFIYIILYHVYILVEDIEGDDLELYKKKNNKNKKIAIGLIIFSTISLVFLPTKNDIIMIYAGGKTMDYIQSDTSLVKIPYQTSAVISKYLDEKIKELNP